jgi:hypothetical protein
VRANETSTRTDYFDHVFDAIKTHIHQKFAMGADTQPEAKGSAH